MSLNIGLYIRVSHEEQALRVEGSLDSQRHRMTGFVDIKNLQTPGWGKIVDNYVDDGFSAKDTNRPALQKLLMDLRKGRINMVLVTDISRLSRSIRDFCQLFDLFKGQKVKFLSLKEQFDTTTAAGEMMLFNMVNLAQFERRQISERVTLNFHSRALRGLRNGGAATIGFYVDPTNKSILKINAKEVPYVQTIFNAYLSEGSLYKAAARLRELKIPTKASASKLYDSTNYIWNTGNLLPVLRNHAYAGLREINKKNKKGNQTDLSPHDQYQVVKAAWPAMIDEATFFNVQKMLDENFRREQNRLKGAERRVFLFSGLSTCAECGRALVGSTGHGQTKTIRYYIHRPLEGRPVTCAIKRFRADEIEESIVGYLLNIMERENYLDGIERTLEKMQSTDYDCVTAQNRDFERDLTEVDHDIKGLIRIQMKTEDEELHELYSEQLKELKGKRTLLVGQLEQTRVALENYKLPKATRQIIQKNLEDFHKAWDKSAPTLRKRLLKTLIHRFVFTKDGVDIFYQTSNEPPFRGQAESSSETTGQAPVVLGTYKKSREKLLYDQGAENKKPPNNTKVIGWYAVEVGCGGV